MGKSEIIQKIDALKATVKLADDLVGELHGVVVGKVFESRDAMFGCLEKGKDIDRAEYVRLCQENAYYENMLNRLELIGNQLSKGVIENVEKMN